MSAAGPTLLRCGPLTAVLDGADLFDIRWGGAQVVQRLYLAVRDEVWNTIPATLSDIRLDADGTGATVTFEATHEHGDIAFAWTGTIRADASGLLAYEMRGTALRDFSYCKIGFNVHHGLRSHAGRAFRCRTLDGEHAGRFGADIEPQLVRDGTLTAMTPDYDRIDIDLGGVGVAMEFDGDRFEMQDHRNWIDANWKSYGTPLSAGFPMTIEAGAELYQRVVLRLRGPVPPELPAVVTARWSDDAGTLPRIGHLLAAPPDDGQVALLRALHPDHLRVDLHPGDDPSGLAQAAALSRALGAGLEVAVFIRPDHVEVDTPAAAWALAGTDARIDRVLVLVETAGFSAFGGACPPRIATAVRSALIARGLPGAPVVAGTSQSFVDVNRDRPDYSGIDGVVFAANPQVHAADDRSLMQNVQAVPDVVDFTRRLYGDGRRRAVPGRPHRGERPVSSRPGRARRTAGEPGPAAAFGLRCCVDGRCAGVDGEVRGRPRPRCSSWSAREACSTSTARTRWLPCWSTSHSAAARRCVASRSTIRTGSRSSRSRTPSASPSWSPTSRTPLSSRSCRPGSGSTSPPTPSSPRATARSPASPDDGRRTP